MGLRYIWSKWGTEIRPTQTLDIAADYEQHFYNGSSNYMSTANFKYGPSIDSFEQIGTENRYFCVFNSWASKDISTSGSIQIPKNNYFVVDYGGSKSRKNTTVYYTLETTNIRWISKYDSTYNYYAYYFIPDKKVREFYIYRKQKNSTSYGNASSANSGAYPANSYSGDYWYVSLGSDTIDPVSLSYTDEVRAGGTVNLTITPSEGIVHGGNITYTIQTTTNGEDWYDAGTTTGTTFAVTVPEEAAIWNVRVRAKDNTGFVSSTYVYGNNIDTWVTVIQFEIVPASGDLGYLTSKNLVAIGVTHVSEQTYSISASINGTPCFSKSDIPIAEATYITLEDETWNELPEETEQTLEVTISFTGSTENRTYTFRKFTYDETSLEGVMEGIARALRIKREYETQIPGRNMPKEIIKIDNPVNTSGLQKATAGELQVFSGYTFFAGDTDMRTGQAMAQPTNVTADTLPPGITAYNQLGEFLTGTGTNVFKTATYTFESPVFNQTVTQTYTVSFTPKLIVALGHQQAVNRMGVKLWGLINDTISVDDAIPAPTVSVSGNKITVALKKGTTSYPEPDTSDPAKCYVYIIGF